MYALYENRYSMRLYIFSALFAVKSADAMCGCLQYITRHDRHQHVACRDREINHSSHRVKTYHNAMHGWVEFDKPWISESFREWQCRVYTQSEDKSGYEDWVD